MIRHPPSSTLFPYTTLSRSHLSSPVTTRKLSIGNRPTKNSRREQGRKRKRPAHHLWLLAPRRPKRRSLRYWLKLSAPPQLQDRKSTRLNSSHLVISYAVFCL